MEVVDKIDKMRQERGWSINNLAMEAMLTQSTLNNMFMRKTEPKLSTLRAICGAFGITLSEFFADLDEDEENDELAKAMKKLDLKQKHALAEFIDTL